MTETNTASKVKGKVGRPRVVADIAEGLGVSKQRAWQLVRRAVGLCEKCGKPADKKGKRTMCKAHAEYDRNRKKKVVVQ